MKFKENIYLKVGLIIFIALLLMIPTAMIQELIGEREYRQQEAIQEVSSKWAEAQTLSGPFITIPYYKYVTPSSSDSTNKVVKIRDFIHLLPNNLIISGNINPEKRYRGIFEIVVYNSTINISGNFEKPDLKSLDIPLEDIQFDKATMSMGINDLRGIEEQVVLTWKTTPIRFNPGLRSSDLSPSGINALLNIENKEDLSGNFSIDLNLNGSQRFFFTPVGKTTEVSIRSDWETPSFNGAFLPDDHSVSEAGFEANWKVLHLNRNFPQLWTSRQYSIETAAFGIDLLLPVDNYQKTYRSVRYAILFVGFTFMVFFFIEILNKIKLHPFQYILAGMALIVFFTLLLSISEHLSFNGAFILSALATLSLVAAYMKAILKFNKLTMLITGLLALLYLFIFVIIQLEDLALLIGSIGLFIVLAVVMYISRKIDWYEVN